MTPPSAVDQVIQAAAKMIVGAALRLLQSDPHQWSTRPCQTCQQITALVDQPFGCILYAAQRSAAEAKRV